MRRLVPVLLVLFTLLALPFAFARSARSEPPDPRARAAWDKAVKRGRQLYSQSWGPGTKTCAECHGPGPNRMRSGRAKSYPKFDKAAGKVISAQQKINQMIKVHTLAKPLPLGSDDLNAIEAYLGTIR